MSELTSLTLTELVNKIKEKKLSSFEITKAFVRIGEKKQGGFGLGLSICRKVMAAHSGKLSIKNNKLGGSCFSLHYPK